MRVNDYGCLLCRDGIPINTIMYSCKMERKFEDKHINAIITQGKNALIFSMNRPLEGECDRKHNKYLYWSSLWPFLLPKSGICQ